MPGTGANSYDAASILGDIRYRRILSILLERSRPMPPQELGTQLAARAAAVPPSETPESVSESVRIDLRHRCLPKLRRVGWVERRSDGLTATPSRLTTTEGLSLPPLQDPEHPHWEPVSTLLARPYRIAVTERLADCEQSLPLARLVDQLQEYARPSRADELPERQQLRTRLYHVDLPELAAAGLVTFDAAERTVGRTALTDEIVG